MNIRQTRAIGTNKYFTLAVLLICFFVLGSGCTQKTQPAQTDSQAESGSAAAGGDGAALQNNDAKPNPEQAESGGPAADANGAVPQNNDAKPNPEQAESGDTLADTAGSEQADGNGDENLPDDMPIPLPLAEKQETVESVQLGDDGSDILRSPKAIREQIEKDVKELPAISMDDILKAGDSDKQHQYILEHLKKNPCQANSEDFAISSDDNPMLFQTKLEQARYKELYDRLYEKHLKEKSCEGKRELTEWGGLLLSGAPEKDLATGKIDFPKSKSCSNGEYKDMNHLLDINPWIYVREFDGKMESIVAGLIWSNKFINREKFPNDFSMDSNLILGIDDKISKGENLTYKDHGTLAFAASSAAYVDEILENILRGSELHVVYGRFIPVDGKYYYILSFRTYSLTDMRKDCPFLNNYITHQYDSGSRTLRPLELRLKKAKSNSQPRRVPVDSIDDKKVDDKKVDDKKVDDKKIDDKKVDDKKAKRPAESNIDLPF